MFHSGGKMRCKNYKLRGILEFFNINSVGSTHHQQGNHLAPRAPFLHGHAWSPSSAQLKDTFHHFLVFMFDIKT